MDEVCSKQDMEWATVNSNFDIHAQSCNLWVGSAFFFKIFLKTVVSFYFYF